ncbi:nuclear transport factor 2 family protein [Actinomadura sp. 21ATH]|uniref:nuclear transport factor 2 family protein n=1 Tax=Actinomadura sp. 21ATH TaxID=1735444 RepID=UPI0035C15C96
MTVSWEAPDDDHPARRAARASMEAAAGGRREEWLALFAPDAVVEDPVGPSMLDPEGKGHRGPEGRARFWDENIARVRKFHFHVKDSFANGPACANVVTITTAMDGGITMTIDCLTVYNVDENGLVTSFRAHWEPDRAMATLKKG